MADARRWLELIESVETRLAEVTDPVRRERIILSIEDFKESLAAGEPFPVPPTP